MFELSSGGESPYVHARAMCLNSAGKEEYFKDWAIYQQPAEWLRMFLTASLMCTIYRELIELKMGRNFNW